MIEKIIKHLKSTSKPFKELSSFSDEPGIYALFFYGDSFPLKNYRHANGEIIYIGKTLKSQKSRAADTHFKTGKTGSSTLRKTFGCLLHEQYKLIPIPRSRVDIDKRRHAHFKFDTKSEEQLTKWMESNLGLAFYPYPKIAAEIDKLETSLINKLTPILNIDRKNTANTHYLPIRLLRKRMSEIAYSTNKNIQSSKLKSKSSVITISKPKISFLSGNINKYEDIWNKILSSVLKAIKNNKTLLLELNKDIFDKAGNRKSYSFNLEFVNGNISNNISGSAVARDLARVLENNKQFKTLSNSKHLKFKMGKDFILRMQ